MLVPTARCDGYFTDCGYIVLMTGQFFFSMLHVTVSVITQKHISIRSMFSLCHGRTRIGNKKRNDTVDIPKDLFLTLCNLL